MTEQRIRELEARIKVLEDENEELREKVRQLEEQQRGTRPMPLEFGLTGSEERMLAILLSRDGAVTKETFLNLMYGGLPDDEPELKIIDVFICKLRKKLKPFDIEVTTIWGRGYILGPAEKKKIRAMQGAMEAFRSGAA